MRACVEAAIWFREHRPLIGTKQVHAKPRNTGKDQGGVCQAECRRLQQSTQPKLVDGQHCTIRRQSTAEHQSQTAALVHQVIRQSRQGRVYDVREYQNGKAMVDLVVDAITTPEPKKVKMPDDPQSDKRAGPNGGMTNGESLLEKIHGGQPERIGPGVGQEQQYVAGHAVGRVWYWRCQRQIGNAAGYGSQ